MPNDINCVLTFVGSLKSMDCLRTLPVSKSTPSVE